MKRVLRWFIGILIVLIALIVGVILSFDTIARKVAEKRIHDETGMETQIGKLNVGFRTQKIRLENIKLINPLEFQGSNQNSKVFLDLPELEVELDAEAFQSNKIHFRSIRLNLAEVHIVQNKDGKQNIDAFTKHPLILDRLPSEGSTNKTERTPRKPSLEFEGIDLLELSLGRARFTSEKNPEMSFDKTLGIQRRVYRDIKNEKDLQSIQLLLALQSGFSLWMQQK